MDFHIETLIDTWYGRVLVSTTKNTATWRVHETMVFPITRCFLEQPDFSKPLVVNAKGYTEVHDAKKKNALRTHREACQFYDAWSRRFAFDKNARSYRPAGNS